MELSCVKLLIFSVCWTISCGFSTVVYGAARVSGEALSEDFPPSMDSLSRYERSTIQYKNFFHKLIPNQFTVQFAGGNGIVSYGIGWHYGRKQQWETELLFGHVPQYHSNEAKMTFTAKQRFTPWLLQLGSRWKWHPLTTGVYFNSLFGEDFWARQPSRYPSKYYGFATKVRMNVFLGGRMYYRFAKRDRKYFQGAAFYYELSTNELYVASALTNRRVRMGDILSLAFGVTLDVF